MIASSSGPLVTGVQDTPGSAPEVAPKPESKKLESLQIGRGIAALMVLLFHSEAVASSMREDSIFKWVFDAGWCGVDYFFVLSGFLMMFIHNRDGGQPARLVPYLRKRFARIYPIYWVLCGLILIVATIAPSLLRSAKLSPGVMWSSLLLFPHQGARLLGVTWTLEYEVTFYALFSVFLLSRKTGMFMFIAWGCAIVATALAGSVAANSDGIPALQPFPLAFLLNLHCIEFLCGIGVAILIRRGFAVQRPGLALALSCVLGLTFLVADTVLGISKWGQRACIAGYAVASTLILLFSVLYEKRYRPVFPAWLRELGSASYAVYLTHFIVISAVHSAVSRSKMLQDLPVAILLVVLVPLALAPGILFHRYVERPLLERLAM